MLRIVEESEAHYDGAKDVTIEAFSNSPLGYHDEAVLLDSVRRFCKPHLALVALDEEEVVGHILFSPSVIRSSSTVVYGMGLAPMSVRSSHQRQGVGSMLVQEGLSRLATTESQFVVVAGHKEFYPRFGFQSAGDVSITHGFEGMPQDILFVRSVAGPWNNDWSDAKVYFHPVFGPQHVEPS